MGCRGFKARGKASEILQSHLLRTTVVKSLWLGFRSRRLVSGTRPRTVRQTLFVVIRLVVEQVTVYFSGLSNVKLGNGVYLSPRKRGGLPHSQLKQFAEFDDASGEYSKMMPMSPEALVWKQEEVPQQEVDRWEQRWCECARMLGQWEDLNQIVTDKGDLPGMLESACRTPLADWARVREVLETMYNANQDVSSRICLYQVCLAVQVRLP